MSAEFLDFAQRLSDEAMRFGLKAKREGGMDGMISIAVAEALMRSAHMARDTAKAIDTRSAETVEHGSARQGESAVRQDLPK